MLMTFSDYILNPMGKNNAVLNSTMRESMRNDYMKRFDNVMVRERGKIDYTFYVEKKSNTYWIHIKIPSEVVSKFYYDTVIKFTADSKIESAAQDLFKYHVKFFSNDPAFVYTYANVFIRNDLFITELKPKMSKLAIKKAPKEKNPSGNIGYVKSLYFAYLYMKNNKLNHKIKFEIQAKPFNLKELLGNIEDADSKIEKRQSEQEKINKHKKRNKTGNKVNASVGLTGILPSLGIKNTKRVGNVGSSIKTVKSTKTVKKK